jgi:hypothetical protein
MKRNINEPKAGVTTAVDQSATPKRHTPAVRIILGSISTGGGIIKSKMLNKSAIRKIIFERFGEKLTTEK